MHPTPGTERSTPPSLRRTLSFFDGTALLVGSVIGSGIFVVPSLIAAGQDSSASRCGRIVGVKDGEHASSAPTSHGYHAGVSVGHPLRTAAAMEVLLMPGRAGVLELASGVSVGQSRPPNPEFRSET
jgi:hypothetical protein